MQLSVVSKVHQILLKDSDDSANKVIIFPFSEEIRLSSTPHHKRW